MHLDRLRVVSALPPDGGWRAELAVDRSTTPPRAVLLARVPPSVSGDAQALSMLARGVDLASRVRHRALRGLLGTGELGGELVLVEAWREGETLRGLLEAGGPLPPELVARVAVEVAGALHAAHTLPAAMGRPLCHGAVRAERIMVAESGEVLLCGLGRPFAEDASPEGDLRDLARVLLESLPAAAAGPGALAPVLDRVLVGEGYPTAAAFAEAVAAAVPPAGLAAMAARLEASQPEGTPAWLGHRRALAQALRAEGGAAAEEKAPAGASAGDVAAASAGAGAGDAASPPGPPQLAMPGATPPAGEATATEPTAGVRPATGEGPGQAPPPLPSGGDTSTATAPSAPPRSTDRARDQFVEVARTTPAAGTRPPAPGSARPLAAWLDHPRAPLVVGLTLGLLGLLLGLALGRR